MEKKVMKVMVVCAVIGLFVTSGLAAGWGYGRGGMGCVNLSAFVSAYPYQDLSEEERAGLLKMREEEKLARDVYLTLYNKWAHQVFSNIANAEQRHMDAVKSLLDKYGMTDPVTDNSVGAFTDPKMSELYNTLVTKGSGSLVNALMVGATIEDLDIYDLQVLLAQTDNEDIQAVYQNLSRGSRNHMRAFSRVLSTYGLSYTAQYLSQEEVDRIVSGAWN